MKVRRTMSVCVAAMACAAVSGEAWATIPYGSAGGPFPGFGPGVIAPTGVGGKEYSHDTDSTTIGAGAVAPPPFDAEQIVAWDGSGGTVDVTDFSFTRPSYTFDDEIDALAHHADLGFSELKSDEAHLVYSVDDTHWLYTGGGAGLAPVPSAGPIVLPSNVIAGAGELSYELATAGAAAGNPFNTHGTWATQPEINGMPLPTDIDSVEVWGPEPPVADGDKYSLSIDGFSDFSPGGPAGTSVWNASGTPYIDHPKIVAAVTSLLGPLPTTAFIANPFGPIDGPHAINLDALMVQDVIGDIDTFEGNPTGGDGPVDEIIFSITQIVDPMDPDGYYATGSELFVLDGDMVATYLTHGGHVWDHTYALSEFDVFFADDLNSGVLDINAIEAVGEFAVPEPASLALLMLGGLALTRRR